MTEQISFVIHEISGNIRLPRVSLGTDHSTVRPFSSLMLISYLSRSLDNDSNLELKRHDESTINIHTQKYNNIKSDCTSCSICLEDFNTDDQVIVLECHHVFHDACISEWGHYKGTCPMCRNNV